MRMREHAPCEHVIHVVHLPVVDIYSVVSATRLARRDWLALEPFPAGITVQIFIQSSAALYSLSS